MAMLQIKLIEVPNFLKLELEHGNGTRTSWFWLQIHRETLVSYPSVSPFNHKKFELPKR